VFPPPVSSLHSFQVRGPSPCYSRNHFCPPSPPESTSRFSLPPVPARDLACLGVFRGRGPPPPHCRSLVCWFALLFSSHFLLLFGPLFLFFKDRPFCLFFLPSCNFEDRQTQFYTDFSFFTSFVYLFRPLSPSLRKRDFCCGYP